MAKPRAVLDTNLFYYAVGVSSDPRLRDDWLDVLRTTHTPSLASPTVVELLTHQDFEESRLWACLDEMFSKRFPDFVQIGYLPFDLHPLREVTTNRDGEGLRQLQDAALRLKIRCESDFLRFVFMVLLVGFLHVLFENRRKELTGSNQANLNLHFKALMESNGEFLAATLTSALMTGYSSGDVEKAVDGAFQGQLWCFAYLSLVSLHTVRLGLCLDTVSGASPELQRQIRDAVLADPVFRQLSKNRANPFELLRQGQYRESVNAYIREIEADFRAHWTMPAAVLRFFIDRLQANLNSGAKFRKNDVIDILLAYTTFADNTVIITNDDGILGGLQRACPMSYSLSMTLRKS